LELMTLRINKIRSLPTIPQAKKSLWEAQNLVVEVIIRREVPCYSTAQLKITNFLDYPMDKLQIREYLLHH
jgi:hypothetical protein